MFWWQCFKFVFENSHAHLKFGFLNFASQGQTSARARQFAVANRLGPGRGRRMERMGRRMERMGRRMERMGQKQPMPKTFLRC